MIIDTVNTFNSIHTYTIYISVAWLFVFALSKCMTDRTWSNFKFLFFRKEGSLTSCFLKIFFLFAARSRAQEIKSSHMFVLRTGRAGHILSTRSPDALLIRIGKFEIRHYGSRDQALQPSCSNNIYMVRHYSISYGETSTGKSDTGCAYPNREDTP